MNEKNLSEFIELATSGQKEVQGFSGYVKIMNVSYYKHLIFRCVSVNDSKTIYKCGNHTVIIRYKNIGSEDFARYTGFVAEYIAPVTELVERSGY